MCFFFWLFKQQWLLAPEIYTTKIYAYSFSKEHQQKLERWWLGKYWWRQYRSICHCEGPKQNHILSRSYLPARTKSAADQLWGVYLYSGTFVLQQCQIANVLEHIFTWRILGRIIVAWTSWLSRICKEITEYVFFLICFERISQSSEGLKNVFYVEQWSWVFK